MEIKLTIPKQFETHFNMGTIPTSSAKNPCSSSSKTQLHNANASWSKTSPTIPIRSKKNLEKTIP